MTYLILGLVIFLGVHSVRIFADGWRTHARASLGELPWKGLYSVLSLIGFGLIVWGFGLARQQPVQLWAPPVAMRHLASLLTLNGNVAHVLLFGAFLVWSVLCFSAARRRDVAQGTRYPSGTAGATGITVAVGVGAWIAFALWLHGLLIGVRPVG